MGIFRARGWLVADPPAAGTTRQYGAHPLSFVIWPNVTHWVAEDMGLVHSMLT